MFKNRRTTGLGKIETIHSWKQKKNKTKKKAKLRHSQEHGVQLWINRKEQDCKTIELEKLFFMICYEPRWWEVLTRSHSRYASVCTVPFHCFNLQQLQLVWFNNSKKVSFSVSGSVTKSGCSSVFFKVFFIDTPVETHAYSFGTENNFQLCFNSTRLHFLPKCSNWSSKKNTNSFCSECWSTFHVKNFTHRP